MPLKSVNSIGTGIAFTYNISGVDFVHQYADSRAGVGGELDRLERLIGAHHARGDTCEFCGGEMAKVKNFPCSARQDAKLLETHNKLTEIAKLSKKLRTPLKTVEVFEDGSVRFTYAVESLESHPYPDQGEGVDREIERLKYLWQEPIGVV